jgi:hypothetical protein
MRRLYELVYELYGLTEEEIKSRCGNFYGLMNR